MLKYAVDGKTLNVIGMHPHSPVAPDATKVRDEHLNASLEFAEKLEGSTVVMGDFNISQFSPKFSRLLNEYDLIDTQIQFGLQPSWHADSLPLLRIPIDQILVNDQVVVHDRYLGESTGSDHLPVIAKIGVQ